MEYATEMIIKAQYCGLAITEVGINFYKEGREGKSHLRPLIDGIKHIKIILTKIH